ncbi:MAG: ATP-binding protein [Rhodospirillales bacterium]|nr:ATP-binding protein [Rhodospirillales bacterium]
MKSLAELRRRLGARPDSEHEQAAVRVVIVALLFLYVVVHAYEEAPGDAHALVLAAIGGGYLAISVAILAAIIARPAPSPARRIVAMIADFSALSGFMHAGGAATAPFYAVYLWIALGNGFRYGLPYLAASVAFAALGFSAVVLTTEFWLREWALALGLLAALVILPGYAATLIRTLTEAKAQAEAASLAKTRFLAGVSHELRTPLNAIIGTSDLMSGTPLDAEQREMVHTVKTAGTTLLALIDDILDVSRIEANRTALDEVDFDLHAVLADVLAIFRPSAGERRLRLAAQIDPAVPWRLHGDAKHLRQIVTNLIGNALKFTQKGAIIVRAEPGEAAGSVRILVADTGIGIPAHLHQRIFERFARADEDVNRRFGGTGLGLAISQSLAELSGGTLTLASEPGRGSTFLLEVAYAPARHPEALPATLPRRLLLLSDEAGILDDLRGRLAPYGVAVVAAGGVEAGVAMLRDGLPAEPLVVVIDARAAGGAADVVSPVLAVAAQRSGATVCLRLGGSAVGLGVGASEEAAAEADVLADLPWPASEEVLVGVLHAAACFAPGSFEPATAEAAAGGTDVARERRSALRILIAEDNPVNRKVTARLLERAGFQATLVESGEDALDALAEADFDAVLLDINMPGISGLDVVKLYRMGAMDQPRIPILALSADATVETKEAALAAGIDVYLTKPVEPSRLIAAIEASIAGRSDRRPPPLQPTPGPAPAPGEDGAPGSEVGEAAGEPEVLNPQALAALNAFSGPDEDFALAILQDFVGNTETLLQQIREAVPMADALAFRAAVHALRGTAGNVGADAMRQFCQELQGMSQERLRVHGRHYVARLERELARLREEVERYGLGPEAAPLVRQRSAG